jgi:hypothetical protein
LGREIEDDEINRACGMYGGEKCISVLVGKSEGKWSF